MKSCVNSRRKPNMNMNISIVTLAAGVSLN
jgi:hypothetical protein